MQTEYLIIFLFFAAAMLYSSVGHAGASGYLAVMAILSFPTNRMKSMALLLNIIVSAIASVQFYGRKYFSKKIFLSFAVSSIPFAFLGGSLHMSAEFYKKIIGIILILSAVKIGYDSFYTKNINAKETENYDNSTRQLNTWQMLLLGAIIGFISGVAGVGGGIFLSPILIFTRADSLKNISGTSALFILVNSISALLATSSNINIFDKQTPYYCAAVVLGGFLGSYAGSRKFDDLLLRKILAVVLIIAGAKMFL